MITCTCCGYAGCSIPHVRQTDSVLAKLTALVLVLLFRATTDQSMCCSRGCTFHLLPGRFQSGTVAGPASQTTVGTVALTVVRCTPCNCYNALGSALPSLFRKYVHNIFVLQRTGKLAVGLSFIDIACSVLSALKVAWRDLNQVLQLMIVGFKDAY